MIDLETYGTQANAVILSIGAREFDPQTGTLGRGYYQNVDRKTQKGRTVDKSTVAWWRKQSRKAKEALKKDCIPLNASLADFKKWLPTSCIVWGNGSTFDITLLTTAYRNKTPWRFWNVRDMRTVKAMKIIPDMKFVGVEHNALDDATNQAKYVSKALNTYLKMKRSFT